MKAKNEKRINKLRSQLRDLAFRRLGILAYSLRFGGVAAGDIIKGELIKTDFVRKMWEDADAKEKNVTAGLVDLGVSQEDINAMIKGFAEETKGKVKVNIVDTQFTKQQAKVMLQKMRELTNGRVHFELTVLSLVPPAKKDPLKK